MDRHSPDGRNDFEEKRGDEQDALSREELRRWLESSNAQTERLDIAPTSRQRLGGFTVACLLLNRTIGSGIFRSPAGILRLTGSSGKALVLWVAGGLITLATALCWIEMGLTVPMHWVTYNGARRKVSSPRSGGYKNYLEYVYKHPDLLITCVFGITYVVFGQLANNCLAFGRFVMMSIYPDHTTFPECAKSGQPCLSKHAILAWAVAVLTVCCAINVCTRQFAIRLNNVFAVAKVAFLVGVAILGIVVGVRSPEGNTCRKIGWETQWNPDNETKSWNHQLGDLALALLYATFPYGGFEQPFHVLAEVRQPQRTFPRAVVVAILLATVLYTVVNVAYLCANPLDGAAGAPSDMLLALLNRANEQTGAGSSAAEASERAVAAIAAVSIFGNLVAQTFAATRVKQEIGKEGILPWSLVWATGRETLLSPFKLFGRRRSRSRRNGGGDDDHVHPLGETASILSQLDADTHAALVPVAATFLHWIFGVALILAAGLPLDHTPAYRLLTYFKTYCLVVVLGVLTVWGLLYLKIDAWTRGDRGRAWHRNVQWRPWLDPLPVVVASLALGFLLVGTFVRPSPANAIDGGKFPWWVGPTTGLAITAGSVFWWLGLRLAQWQGRWRLVRQRIPYIDMDADGEAVQKAEIVIVEKVANGFDQSANLRHRATYR